MCVRAGVHARASVCVFVNICEVSWVGSVGRCVTKCVCVHASCSHDVISRLSACVCVCVCVRMCARVCVFVYVFE